MKGRDRWERCANKQKRRRRRRDREKRSVDELTVRRWRFSVRSQQKKETRETAGNVQNENVALKRVKYNSSQKTTLFQLFVCFFILSLFYSIYFKKSYLIPKLQTLLCCYNCLHTFGKAVLKPGCSYSASGALVRSGKDAG